MSEIEKQVRDIIVDKLCVNESEIKLESSFQNDLGADSLDTVELIMEFERVFEVSIPDDKAEKIATVGDAIKYIEDNLNKNYSLRFIRFMVYRHRLVLHGRSYKP